MKENIREKIRKELWYSFFNEYLYKRGIITIEQKHKLEEKASCV